MAHKLPLNSKWGKENDEKNSNLKRIRTITLCAFLALGLYVQIQERFKRLDYSVTRIVQGVPENYDDRRIRIFQAMLLDERDPPTDSNKKGQEGNQDGSSSQKSDTEYVIFTPAQRREFLLKYGHLCLENSDENIEEGADKENENKVLKFYDSLQTSKPWSELSLNEKAEAKKMERLQMDLWKYCIIGSGYAKGYIDYDGVHFLQTFSDSFLRPLEGSRAEKKNYVIKVHQSAITGGSAKGDSKLVHPSVLIWTGPDKSGRRVGKYMVRILMSVSRHVLLDTVSALWQSRQLYQRIEEERSEKKDIWEWLESRCVDIADPSSSRYGIWDNLKIDPNEDSNDFKRKAGDGVGIGIGMHTQVDSGFSLIHTSVTPDANSRRITHHCPRDKQSPCCEVRKKVKGNLEEVFMLLQHPLAPQIGSAVDIKENTSSVGSSSTLNKPITSSDDPIRLPYLLDHKEHFGKSNPPLPLPNYNVKQSETSYMSTVRETQLVDPELKRQKVYTPSFFDFLFENDCLPTTKECQSCLKKLDVTDDGEVNGRTCNDCAEVCECYCSVLCKIRPSKQPTVKEYTVYPPALRKDAARLIPRIVHQTWYEPVTPQKYPNMSRLIESWKHSGWEYNFYDDDTAAEFLSTHFPPEVREAYDSITPGAFKADLFRYCVLLIKGGVYSDMDVFLTSNLDEVITGDIGFITPVDEPGFAIGKRSCLWNGLIGVAPGHPFIAQTIEIVVNNIRNRFTSVDYDDMLCPDPALHVSHAFDTLFVCGPCIFGAGINTVLGNHMQDQIEIGEMDIWFKEREINSDLSHATGESIAVKPDDPRLLIPGRSVILSQNKQDMGEHRFTFQEKNMLVASTDLPNYDDRPKTIGHYSDTHGKQGIYGVKLLYRDSISANELIRIKVVKGG